MNEKKNNEGMQYYSRVLKKLFDTPEELLAAEKEYSEQQAALEAKRNAVAEARKARAKEIEDAYKAYMDAQKNYFELRQKFINDYGSFHMTYSSKDDGVELSSYDWIFKFF